MKKKIKHEDLFRYSREEVEYLKSLLLKLDMIEKELQTKLGLSIDDLKHSSIEFLNK